MGNFFLHQLLQCWAMQAMRMSRHAIIISPTFRAPLLAPHPFYCLTGLKLLPLLLI
jgi:hypothetical protein